MSQAFIWKTIYMIKIILFIQGCHPAMAPADFGRSVNPISTGGRGGRLCQPNNTCTPGFSDLPTALLFRGLFLSSWSFLLWTIVSFILLLKRKITKIISNHINDMDGMEEQNRSTLLHIFTKDLSYYLYV